MAVAKAAITTAEITIADLITIALFFCLRSCEYTKTTHHRRTVQFRMQDMQFRDELGILPLSAPSSRFLRAHSITLFLDTQKNSVRGESVTMEANDLPHGNPVAAAARRFLHLRAHHASPTTPICTYYSASSGTSPPPPPTCVTSRRITATLRKIAGILGFEKLGFHPHEIGSHSLRSGGAMTLHLSGHPDSTIKKIGRWRSDGFLIYLQGQVVSFTKGVSRAMSKVPWFFHTSPAV
jgi:hypothetical protein